MKNLAQDVAQATQRVRVGMLGLAVVLLLIGLAAAILTTASRNVRAARMAKLRSDPVANMIADNSAAATGAATREPLAELGVAPSADTNVEDGNGVGADNRLVSSASRP